MFMREKSEKGFSFCIYDKMGWVYIPAEFVYTDRQS